MDKQDYYKTLGINKNASQKDIKGAFRKLAIQYHPDKNQDVGAESKFKEISEAYDVLSDEEKRKAYDMFGHNASDAGFEREDIFSHFSDLFGDLGFGDFFTGSRSRRKVERKGTSIQVSTSVDLDDVVAGVNKNILFKRNCVCKTCMGAGYMSEEDISSCLTCNGSGAVTQKAGFVHINMTCPSCSGHGREIINPCKACKGSGILSEVNKINVFIPPGIENGMKLKLDRMGNLEPGADIPGDAYVHVIVNDHDLFERDRSRILSQETISFTQATLGDVISVATLDGDIDLNIPKGTQPGTIFKIARRGLPRDVGSDNRDNHYITIQISIPIELTKLQEKIISDLRDVM